MPRILKILFAAAAAVVAAMAGAVVLVAVAALFIGFLLVRGLRRRFARPASRSMPRQRTDGAEVIDVVATEIPTPKD